MTKRMLIRSVLIVFISTLSIVGSVKAYDNLRISSSINNATNVFGGTALFPNGTAAAPSISFSNDTNSGLYLASGDYVALSTGGTQVMAWNNNGVTSTSIVPMAASTYNLGAPANRWNALHVNNVTFGASVVMANYATTFASTTAGLTGASLVNGDTGLLARELILTGESAGSGAQSLSLIEGNTSTLKITNGNSSGQWGGLEAATSTFKGRVEISAITNTSTLRIGVTSKPACIQYVTPTGTVWYATFPYGQMVASLSSCE